MKINGQLLHWVFKTSNLKTDVLDLYEGILGMHVLRHEEFSSGCDAQCNGPYARPWSKTMIGYGNESDSFVMELAFNYGIPGYKNGNDFRYLFVRDDDGSMLQKCRESTKFAVENENIVKSNDNYGFKLVRTAEYATVKSHHKIMGCSINVENLSQSQDYYVNVLGMKVLKTVKISASNGKNLNAAHLVYDETDTILELVETGEKINHASAIGRLAIAVPASQMEIIEKKVNENNDKIHTERIKLETPGKATVEVVILLDRDGYEICIVGSEAFFELSKPVKGTEYIDWKQRSEMGSKE